MCAGLRSLSGGKDKTDTIRPRDGSLHTLGVIDHEAAEGIRRGCAGPDHREDLPPLRPQSMLLADSLISRADENRC